ncbi:pimeloyl-ACP methyl ester carboxylesterase [Streptosporangium becharense]|uniref:Pimeloyl-ACP methyl ester carboxylesterase n=1 Tax=Streptosporangium becharense TaxID=1816182 RepID=A0A7W9ILU0_9ACTN|nr:alpha/beta hydrolase [Streptosporangium becharense]MBB2910370.1 pimeloyl-ACP methyl ester carboxylesterase [Streptosporangium becharense]MBB5823113.1 pimeloyl-ACP methyl ester carboxylesterase [Streptosporangium becharense]
MRHADWGVRSPRWAGIRSEEIDVCGTAVHYLSTGASRGGPTHLLVHPMAGSASMWLDLIGPLSALGPVVAPDLPGTLFGHTGSPHPQAVRAEPSARFLKAFAARLGIEEAVVHGWSMGGLVALLFADAALDRVGRLVLTCPALPGPLPADEVLFWRALGRPLLAVAPPVAQAVLRLTGRRLLDFKLSRYADPSAWSADAIGGDLSRLSPDMTALLADELRAAQPRRLGAAVTAFASVLSALFVDQRPVHQAIARVGTPTLLLWGDQDGLITRNTVDDLATRRPDWERQVFPTVGHLLPLETPRGYVEAVARWLAPQGSRR